MKKLLLVTSLFITNNVLAKDCSRYDNLSPLQKGRLEFAYNQGKSRDLGYTLASIALTESNAGKWRLNLNTKDVGLFQTNLNVAARTLGVTNHYKKLELAQKLIYDDILNAYVALSVLDYFNKYHKGDWRKMVQSYNTGHKINTEKSKKYLDKVVSGVKVLQQCMKVYN